MALCMICLLIPVLVNAETDESIEIRVTDKEYKQTRLFYDEEKVTVVSNTKLEADLLKDIDDYSMSVICFYPTEDVSAAAGCNYTVRMQRPNGYQWTFTLINPLVVSGSLPMTVENYE